MVFKSVNCITDLDDFSLIEIFSHISNVREKIRLKRVCRRFHDIATQSLKMHHSVTRRSHLYYTHEIRTSARPHLPLDRLLSCCPNIKHLSSIAFDRICWNKKRLPATLYFQSLALHGWSHMKISSTLLPKCKVLQSLEIGTAKYPKPRTSSSTSVSPIASYEWNLCCVASNLVSLRLEGVNYSLDSVAKYMRERGSSLRHFSYSSWSIKDTASLDPTLPFSLLEIILRHTAVEKVDLELRGSVKAVDDTSCLPQSHSVRTLSIKSDASILMLLKNILTSCSGINDILIVEPLYNDKEILEYCQKYVRGKIRICTYSLTNFYNNR